MRVLYMHTLRDERTGRALQPPRGTSGLLRDAAHDARDRPEPRVVERGGRRRISRSAADDAFAVGSHLGDAPRRAYSTIIPRRTEA